MQHTDVCNCRVRDSRLNSLIQCLIQAITILRKKNSVLDLVYPGLKILQRPIGRTAINEKMLNPVMNGLYTV